MKVRRLAVIGVGLIGGSTALALKRAGSVERVVGIGRGRANLERALELGVVDEIAADAASGVEGADAVVVAVPVGQFDGVLRAIAPRLDADVLVTDGGSTKQDVIAVARPALGGHWPRFVPAHPIAGAEHSGVDAARADLYDGRNVVLTPVPETAPDAVDRAESLWKQCGARVARMSAAEHDGVFAAVSHLPHVLAYALVAMIAERADAERLFAFAAGGFRDFTRIASSSPEMWRDIALANRDALLGEIDRYGAALASVRELVAAADGEALERLFAHSRDARNAWLRRIEEGR
ncbi:MAG: prephenate dehydrogenase/arogenate dehydrogenase family protein [Burkholderiales bacterium]|nr:prephenate dehydrogenase/arogenate dehydrogenase family protein [Burkholderiales bacterium]